MADKYKVNPFTGNFDFYQTGTFQGVSSSSPSSPQDGWTYINSSTNGYYLYYSGTWFLLHTLSTGTSFFLLEDGFKLLLETGADSLLLE